MCNIWIAIFWLFWLIFGQKIASHTCRSDFLHKWIVHKKFQLKIPTLSKNDCSATWKPNTNQKNFMRDQLRNVQRYQKYVPIFQAFFLTVSVQFKPMVWCHYKKLLPCKSQSFFKNLDYDNILSWVHYKTEVSIIVFIVTGHTSTNCEQGFFLIGL